jgi:PKD repeat protein
VSTFLWNFGDNQTSTDVNPTHTYTTSGIFNVTLTQTNANGCIHDTVKQVVVNPKPLSGFTWSSPACDSTMVYFTDQSSVPVGTVGHIMQWKWVFQ